MTTDEAGSGVLDDVRLIVGGGFHLDAIGPDRLSEVTARVAADPRAYVRAFEQEYLGPNFDARTQAALHATVLVTVLRDVGASDYRDLAAELLRYYDGALVIYDHAADKQALGSLLPDQAMDLVVRLDDRRRVLAAVLEAGEG
jgi:hypothetical protein